MGVGRGLSHLDNVDLIMPGLDCYFWLAKRHREIRGRQKRQDMQKERNVQFGPVLRIMFRSCGWSSSNQNSAVHYFNQGRVQTW